MKRFILLLFAGLFFTVISFASNITSNAVTGNWSSTSSWVGGVVPGVNDSVIIVNGAQITLNTNATVYKMRISSGGTFNLSSYKLKLNGNSSDNGSMSIYGTLNLNSGTLELTGNFYTGSSTYPGIFNSGTGTVNFTGNEHQMISGTTIPAFYNLTTSNTNNALQKGVTGHPVNTIITGNFVANGVFNRSSDNNYPAKVTFNGNTTLSGLYSFFLNHVEIAQGATLNAGNKTIYMFGNWTNNGTFVCGTSTLWFSYDPNHPTHPDQTITNVNAQSNPFYNLYINKSTGSVSPQPHPSDMANPLGHLWLNGSFTVNNGTWVNGERQLWVKKDFIVNSGTYNAGLGRVVLNGSTQQLLKTASSNLYKFTVDNSGQGVLLVSDVTVTNELVLTNGPVYTTESYQVFVSNNATNAITSYSGSSFIVGRLRRGVVSGAATYVYPVGPMNVTPLKYRPVTYEQTSSGGASNLSMIADTLSSFAHLANWYIRMGTDAGNPVGNCLFSYNLSLDFNSGVNECALSVNQGTNPPPAAWNNVLSTVTGASGGNNGILKAAMPASLTQGAFIIGEPVPQINNTSVCNNNSVILQVINPQGTTNFNWYNAPTGGTLLQGASTSYTTPVLTGTTTYYVAQVNNATSCITAYRTPVTVTVGNNINVNIIPNGPTSICGNGSVVLDAGGMYNTYQWQNMSSSQTITASTAGVYTVNVSDINGCTGSGSINVSITPMPGNAGPVNGPASLCQGASTTYTITPVPNTTTYTWAVPNGMSIINGQGTNTINVVAYAATSGYVNVTPSNICGGGTPSSLNVSITNAPDDPMSISGPNAVCSGQIATYTIPFVPGATGYQWDVPSNTTIVSGTGTNSITVDWGSATTGTISVTPYNACGNATPTSIYVTVSQFPPSVSGSITGPLVVCQGSLTDYFVNPVTNATGYIWEVPLGISVVGGQNTNTITVEWQYALSGYVMVTPTNGCGIGASDSVFVVSQPAPAIPVIDDTLLICPASSVTIGVMPVSGVTFNWYDSPSGGLLLGTGDSISLGNISGILSVWVEAVGSNSCSNPGGRKEVYITVWPTTYVTLTCDAVANEAILGQAITFTAAPAVYNTYIFEVNNTIEQNSTSNIFITNTLQDKDTVTVWVIDENGCLTPSDDLIITIKPIPNAFSPNADGVNDVFMENFDLTIINRWGQELYKGTNGWDGTYKGDHLNTGTYYYLVSYLGLNEEIITVTGSVTLTR